jgi:two-component system, OmpR family, response regulator
MVVEPAARVLIVDDDHAVRSVAAEILRDEGYEVDEAANAHAVLAKLRSARFPWVVLLDQRLPDMTGCEVLANIRAEGFQECNHAFILLTGAPEQVTWVTREAASEAYVDACVPVLGKPFDLATLIQVVDAAARRIQAGVQLSAPTSRSRG